MACNAYGCKNRTVNKNKRQLDEEASGKKISFHRFPKDSNLKKKWIDAVRRKDWKPSKYSSLCSNHFDEECFDRTSLVYVRLKENAIPTIFTGFPPHLQKKLPIKKRKISWGKEPVASATTSTSPEPRCHSPSLFPGVSMSSVTESEEPRPSSCTTRSRFISPKRIKNSLTKYSYLGKKKYFQNKIKSLQTTKLQKSRSLPTLRNVLKDLKEKFMMRSDELDVLENIIGPNKNILVRQMRTAKGLSTKKEYEPELRTFALTLFYYSPAAYEYVRQHFGFTLPPRNILRKWLQVVEGNPGFCREALQALKLRASLQKEKILCNLVFDEMFLRRQVIYDGKKYVGYVDSGTGLENDDLDIASEALVFLLVAINGDWKVPIAYFLINGTNASIKTNLVRECINFTKENSIRIVSLTFNGTHTNFSVAKNLGCNFDMENMQTYFISETGDKICVFLDACRMLKLIRNAWSHLKHFYLNGKQISWKYIEQLNKLQIGEGLHLANKLKTSNILFSYQKIKESHASQLFSNSVADAIDFCWNELKIPEFENSQMTVVFLKEINNLFDVFNSKWIEQKNYKKPLNSKNELEIFDFLKRSKHLLKSLKTNNNQLLIHHPKKTGFLGFLICIESLQTMYLELVKKSEILSCIPTYKLSQDHLELLFSTIRGQEGSNDNPSAIQFRNAFRKILVHTELKETLTGNCIPLEQISILHCSSSSKVIDVINDTSQDNNFKKISFDEPIETIEMDHSYCLTKIEPPAN